jgi:hypothetical protein
MARLVRLLIMSCAVLMLFELAACPAVEDSLPPFTVAWTYDTNGQLEPCGCSSDLLGGLSRRATIIEELRAQGPLLAIEGAHIFEEEGGFQLFKGEIITKALNTMEYDAMMLGVREAQQGMSGIAAIEDLADFPLFSANLVVDGESWHVPSVIVDVDGASVGITGVSKPDLVEFELSEGTVFTEPEQALTSVLDEMAEKAQVTIVCLEGEMAWQEKIADAFAERADLFLGGDRLQDPDRRKEAIAQLSGAARKGGKEMPNLQFITEKSLLNNWGKGMYLGVIEVLPRRGGAKIIAANRPILYATEAEQEINDILESDYKPRLQEFFADFAGELIQNYIGPSECGDCHVEEYENYLATAHSRSFTSLKDVGRLYDPDCMCCHVVYDQTNDQLHAINCLVCHTNIIWQHEWLALENMVVVPEKPVTVYTYESCSRCHDPENSVPFAEHWPQYVNLIYHGGDISKAEQAAMELGIDITEPPPDLIRAARDALAENDES